ncbi:protein kinase domain-containing protein [Coleofasciculus chthonoplastes]|uniref:protein kinase domain-containing protein n=1 Tax=Coleofasciculus chthonoplastes TaxID=64178 RepID=UPI0032F32863
MMPQTSTHWNVGDTILDLYQVLDILGEGGFGKVYKVHHQGWNVDLAVKSPKPEIVVAAGGVESFEREAETWVNLGLHPHTVSCYYVRRIENSPLVFAEYVAGGSLADWIENRRLYEGGVEVALKRILDIAIQFAWGLHHAHEQGLIHQDVKPANVMITPQGVVKVTDFGLAKGRMNVPVHHEGEEGTHTLITEGSGAMTPAYCSPEQASGESLTRRTDLWSWAVSVLEMFQGERTWSSGTIFADADALDVYLQNQPEDLDLPQIPESVAQLLRRCFRENPNERPHTMLDVANELRGIYEQVLGEVYPREEAQTAKDIADSLNNRAASLLDLGREEEALKCWQQALEIQPQHLEATYNQGLVLWRKGKIYDDVLVRDMEQVQLSYKESWIPAYLLSLIHLERDDCEAATKTLERIQKEWGEMQEVNQALAEGRKRFPYSKRLLRTFEGHTGGVISVSLDASGRLDASSRLAISGSQDKNLILWDVESGRALQNFRGHQDWVESVCLSWNSHLAVSGSLSDDLETGIIKIWNVETGNCLRTIDRHCALVTSVCFSTDNKFILSASLDKDIILWDTRTAISGNVIGSLIHHFEGHTEGVNSVCFSEDNRLAISGSRDNTVKLWDVETGECIYTFEGHTGSVNAVLLSRAHRFALSGSSDKTLKLWDISTGKCVRTFETNSSVGSVCLSSNNKFALSSTGEWKHEGIKSSWRLWDVETGRCLRTFEGHTGAVKSLCLSYDGCFALSGSEDKTLKLWMVKDQNPAYHASIAIARPRATEALILADLIYKEELAKAQKSIEKGDYVDAARHIRKARSQPGKNYQTEARNIWASLYTRLPRKNFKSAWEIASFVEPEPSEIARLLSADGQFYLIGQELQDTKTGSHICRFEQIERIINRENDVKLIKIDYPDESSFNLIDEKTGQLLFSFQEHQDAVSSVLLSREGHLALSRSKDKTLKLWFLDWELEEKIFADWDEGAREYLDSFLNQHTPQTVSSEEPDEKEIVLAFERLNISGETQKEFQQLLYTLILLPTWTDKDFQELLWTLGCVGYGWLRPEGIEQQLTIMWEEKTNEIRQQVEAWQELLTPVLSNPHESINQIFEPQGQQKILHWLGRTDVAHHQKEILIKALINFQDKCNNFYHYQAYFLAAIGIAELENFSLSDELGEQLVRWSFGYADEQQKQWQQYLQPLREAARKTLRETAPQTVISRLTQLLNTCTPNEIKRQVAQELGQIDQGNKIAIDTLIKLLRSHKEQENIKQVIQSLGEVGQGNQLVFEELLNLIRISQDQDVVQQSVKSIVKVASLNASAIKDNLIEILFDTDHPEYFRKIIAQVLDQIAHLYGVIEDLYHEYITTNSEIHFPYIWDTKTNFTMLVHRVTSLYPGRWEDAVIETLTKILRSSQNELVCRRAIKGFEELGISNQRTIEPLIEIVNKTQDQLTCISALKTLEKLAVGDFQVFSIILGKVVEIIVNQVTDDNFRLAACASLKIISQGVEQKTVQLIVQFLINTEFLFGQKDTRSFIVNLLGEVGISEPLAINAMERLLAIYESNSREIEIVVNLLKIDSGNQKAIEKLMELLANKYARYSENKLLNIADILKTIVKNNPNVLQEIQELLRYDLNPNRRRILAEIIGEVNPQNQLTIDILIEQINYSSELEQRNLAVQSLGKIGTRNLKAVECLTNLLCSNESELIYQVVTESLRNVLQNEFLFFYVINKLNNLLPKKIYESADVQSNSCYKIAWYCAQNLPYLVFYKAYNSSQLNSKESPQKFSDTKIISQQLLQQDIKTEAQLTESNLPRVSKSELRPKREIKNIFLWLYRRNRSVNITSLSFYVFLLIIIKYFFNLGWAVSLVLPIALVLPLALLLDHFLHQRRN